jgi:hypothetical protein
MKSFVQIPTQSPPPHTNRRKSTQIISRPLPSSHFSFLIRSSYRGADKSLSRLTSLSIVSSIQGTGGSQTGPDPENRVRDQDTGSPGRPVSSGLQVPGEQFPSDRAKELSAPRYCNIRHY